MKKYSILSAICGMSVLSANPVNPTVVSGTASFMTEGNLLEITTTSNRTIIDWGDFSIDAGEFTKFVQPNQTAATLNRVLSANPSQIMGELTSNGSVFLINQNGILVGATGIIDVGALVASTLDVSNSEFLAGGDMLFTGESTATVENQGSISAGQFDGAILIGRHIVNSGDVLCVSGHADLGAGTSVLIKADSETIYINPDVGATPSGVGIDNSGTILGNTVDCRADGNLYTLAINHSGAISALATAEHDGEVYLVAESGETRIYGNGSVIAQDTFVDNALIQVLGETITLEDHANLNTSNDYGGGNIYVGGGYQGSDPDIMNAQNTSIGPDVTIHSDALILGNAGQVVVWADGTTDYQGAITATGGRTYGNGGLVEISGLQDLIFEGTVSTEAYYGVDGLLVLDPTNIVISGAATAGGSFDGGSPLDTFSGTAAAATLNSSDLNTALNSNNVLVTTTSGFGSAGNITIGATTSLNLTTSHTLTLSADNDIIISSPLTMIDSDAGTSVLNLVAGNDVLQTAALTTTNLDAVNLTTISGDILIDNAISAASAAVNLTSGNDIISQGGGINSLISQQTTWTAANDITFTNDMLFTGQGTGSDLAITATNDFNINNVITFANWDSALLATTTGDIIIDLHVITNGTTTLTLSSGNDLINQGGTNLINDIPGNFSTVNLNAVNDITINSQIDMNNLKACNFSAGNDFILNNDFEPDRTRAVSVSAGRDIVMTAAATDVIATDGDTLSFTAGRDFTNDEPFTVAGFDNLNITTTTGDVTFINSAGNANVTTADTVINSGNDVDIRAFLQSSSGDITINANNDINIGPATVVSQVGSVSGNITMSAGRDLNVTGGPSTSTNDRAQIGFSSANVNSNIDLTVARDLNVISGGSSNNVALIGHGFGAAGNYKGDIIIRSVGRDLTITGDMGAVGSTKFAQIGHTRFTTGTSSYTGDVRGPTAGSAIPIGGTLTLNGGSDSTAYALLGHGGRNSNAIGTYTGDVRVKANAIVINGGSSADAFAGIGYLAVAQGGGTNPIVIATPSTVQAISDTTITMTGSTNGVMSIGARTLTTSGHPSIISLDLVDVQAGGDLTMTSGTGTETDALIGVFSEFGVVDTALTVTVGGDLIMTTGTGANVRITNGSGSSALKNTTINVAGDIIPTVAGIRTASITAGTGNLEVIASGSTTLPDQTFIENFGGSNGSLTVKSGSLSAENGGFIRNSGTGTMTLASTTGDLTVRSTSFATAFGNTTLTSTNDLILFDDGSITSTGGALTAKVSRDISITGTATGPSSLESSDAGFYQAGHDITLIGAGLATEGFIENSAGDLQLIAGSDLTVNFFGRAENLGTGSLTLVIDNQNPSFPQIGTGAFDLSTFGSVGRVGGGPLRIFTAVRSQNNIAGVANLNGTTFTPGTLFVNSATEQWNTYPPSSFGGSPFTLFYKDGPEPPPIVAADMLALDPNVFTPFYEISYMLEMNHLDPVVAWLVPLIVIDNLKIEILKDRRLPPYIKKLDPRPHHQ